MEDVDVNRTERATISKEQRLLALTSFLTTRTEKTEVAKYATQCAASPNTNIFSTEESFQLYNDEECHEAKYDLLLELEKRLYRRVLQIK